MSEEEPKSPRRRDFLNVAVGGSAVAFAAAMAYPAARFVQPRTRVDTGTVTVGKLEDFPIGGAKTVLFHDRPVLVLRSSDGHMRAFSAICSHLHCIVGFSAEKNQIECPCHQGVYSVDGQVVSGPPPRPLEELVVTINEGSVLLSTLG
jgi:cytochrome b6-f complex iron-sulfur subunit